VKPMSTRETETAEALTFGLADAMCKRIPALWTLPAEVIVDMALPIACELVRLEAKAARNSRHAKKYRKAKCHVRALLATPLPATEARPAAQEPSGAAPCLVPVAPGGEQR
jgi:hypothetical protein